MKIISHRGLWYEPGERNTKGAFHRSLSSGFGLETDLRDCLGTIVISHDPPMGQEMTFEEFLALHSSIDPSLPLALNIKADGLTDRIVGLLEKYHIQEYFCFDMSLPDTIHYKNRGLNYFTRHSDIELEPMLLEHSRGVWMDMFHSDWVEEQDVMRHLNRGKNVCLVSPELHRRPLEAFWERIARWTIRENPDFILCTDYPEQAKDYFNTGNNRIN